MDVPSSSVPVRNLLAHPARVPRPPRHPAHGARCTPPALSLADHQAPVEHRDVPASPPVEPVLPLGHVPASEHVPVEHLAPFPAPAKHLPACVPQHVPANAAAVSVTRRPKKAR